MAAGSWTPPPEVGGGWTPFHRSWYALCSRVEGLPVPTPPLLTGRVRCRQLYPSHITAALTTAVASVFDRTLKGFATHPAALLHGVEPTGSLVGKGRWVGTPLPAIHPRGFLGTQQHKGRGLPLGPPLG